MCSGAKKRGCCCAERWELFWRLGKPPRDRYDAGVWVACLLWGQQIGLNLLRNVLTVSEVALFDAYVKYKGTQYKLMDVLLSRMGNVLFTE